MTMTIRRRDSVCPENDLPVFGPGALRKMTEHRKAFDLDLTEEMLKYDLCRDDRNETVSRPEITFESAGIAGGIA